MGFSESFLCCFRKEVPSEEDLGEEAPHQRGDSQAAAVAHLEDGERLLRVCSGTVSVCASARRQGKERRAVRARSELFLREDLPQSKLNRSPTRTSGVQHTERICCSFFFFFFSILVAGEANEKTKPLL